MARSLHPNNARSASRDGRRETIRLQAVLLRSTFKGFEFHGPHGQRNCLPASAVGAFLCDHNLSRTDRATVNFWLQRWHC